MAFEQTMQLVGMVTAQSFASLQNTFVVQGTTGIVAPGGAGVICDGVIQDDNPNSGTESAVAVSGIVKIVTSGTVVAGDLLMCAGTGGQAATATASNHILGRALQGNGGNAGSVIPMLILRGGHASSGI